MLDEHVLFGDILFFNGDIYKHIVVDNCLTHYAIGKNGCILNLIKMKLLKKHKNPDLYVQLVIQENTYCYHFLVHRLVALAFLPRSNSNMIYVNHIDFDRSNNDVSNLEWCTQSENEIHKQQRMNYENNCHYSDNQIIKVCKLLAKNTHSMSKISDMTGVPYSIITKIRRREYRVDISKDFAIENYIIRRQGNINNTVVEHICREFEINKLSVPEISNKYHVTKNNVRSILYRATYRDISMKYDFSNYDVKDYHLIYSDEMVHLACQLFENNEFDTKEISNKTGIPLNYLSDIRNHKKRKNISVLYDIDKYDKYFIKEVYPEDLLKNIDDLLKKGYRNCEVRDILHLPKTQKIKSLIANHKNRMKLSN